MSKIKSWADISLQMFEEISLIDKNKYEFESDYYIELISIVEDIPIEKIEDMYIDDYNNLLKSYHFLHSTPPKIPKRTLNIKGETLHLIKDFNSITVGEFIDLENLFSQGVIENFKYILPIVYRREIIKGNDFFTPELEPYGNWIYHRAPLFSDVSIIDVFGVINNYMNFREPFLANYQPLFNSVDELIDEDEEIDTKGMSSKEKLGLEKEIQKSKSIKKWGWDILLYRLAGGDITKIEEITAMPIALAFNILAMKLELNIND